jgi:predicted nucleic acid-binding Zn ribbon protein
VASPEFVPSNNGWAKGSEKQKEKKEVSMIWTLVLILFVAWLLGLFAFHAGGLIHILLVIALIVVIVRLLQGRKVL